MTRALAPRAVRVAAAVALASLAVVLACGETRRPIGDECIRDEDCLSDVCAARVCASAPSLVTGATNPPPAEEPRIPDEGGTTSIADAAGP